MRITTVLGARPQFIKAAPVSHALKELGHSEFMIHTGQHYDYGMSQVFFEELNLPQPEINLGVGSGSHAFQTGCMLVEIEKILLDQKPDFVLVYGDTNSTLAGALAAVKIHVPVAHIEAGLRSYNRCMPEEHNRILADHCADLLFCPTQTAVGNLKTEGIVKNVHWVGDTMYDSVLMYTQLAQERSDILKRLALSPGSYSLVTVHRAYNTDDPDNLGSIVKALCDSEDQFVFPIHPRTRKQLISFGLMDRLSENKNMIMCDPLGYLDMLQLQQNARLILTDSGGMQKEAYFLGVPCITLRPETEWVETVQAGWNVIVSANSDLIRSLINEYDPSCLSRPMTFGDGKAGRKIVEIVSGFST